MMWQTKIDRGWGLSYQTYFSRFVLAASICIVVFPARALSLADAVLLARQTDPIYLSAQANLTASHGRSSQALANLLPQISATANTTTNRRNYEVRDTTLPPTDDAYNSNSAQLSVTQPLWRRANWIARTQAQAAVAQADYQRAAAEQDLLVRLAQAWFDVMLARDVVVFSGAQLASAQHQWEQYKQGFELGLLAGPALEEIRTKYDQANAEYVSAETEQSIKTAELEQIIGPLPLLTPPSLSDDYAMDDPPTGTLQDWLSHAEASSPIVLAALRAYEAASEEVRKQRAGHDPTLDMVATYGRNSQAAGTFPGQNGFNIKQQSVGFQLNIPIFSGGGQNAKVSEAIALRDKAAQDLESAKMNVRLTSKQAWFGWQAGNARQTAALQSKKFSTLSLESAVTGKFKDVKVELDILQARQQFYGSIRDLHKARYEMISSRLKLKAIAGELLDTDLTAIDAWLVNDTSEAGVSVAPQTEDVLQAQ